MATIKIAVYGKGGIGKSTISANVSAALSRKKRKVLQIGCDPKHDSTRLLLGGKTPKTVLEYIREVLPEERKLEDIVFSGYKNIACVEAGGPEPGVGCAGRGIITTFELLESLGLGSYDFDYVIYDVLGDVVCGGFAVPIRKDYAEAIYIVTSGEFMALYAANNILKGIKNFGNSPERVAGIIHNSRGLQEEDERVFRFADSVHLPIVAQIPRSELFAAAEKVGKTVIEAFPTSSEAGIFRKIAGDILSLNKSGGTKLYSACPLSNDILESVVLGVEIKQNPEPFRFSRRPDEKTSLLVSESVKTKHPLHGCAFAGVVCVTTQIEEAYTLMHCPQSCAHLVFWLIESAILRMHRLYGYSTYFDITKKLGTTNTGENDFIFGGDEKLKSELEKAVNNNHKEIFVVTACPPGMVGDDVISAAEECMKKYPDVRVEPVLVDGNLEGDFLQGYIHAIEVLTKFIEKNLDKKENTVNIIGEKSLATNKEYDYSEIKALLDAIGISINCRFAAKTSINSIRSLNRGSLNLPAHNDYSSRLITELISRHSNLPMLDTPFPTGFSKTSEWLMKVAEFFGKEEAAKEIIESEERKYRREINRLRPLVAGKRVLISTYSRDIDWILELADDLGMEIVRIGLMHSPSNEPLRTEYSNLPVKESYNSKMRKEEIKLLSPDLMLIDQPRPGRDEYVRNNIIPYTQGSPGLGFMAGIRWAERWCRTIKLPVIEGWKSDGDDIL